MEAKELAGWVLAVMAIASYAVYIILKRKELKEEDIELNKTEKLIDALKEYSRNQPELAKIFSKFGIL